MERRVEPAVDRRQERRQRLDIGRPELRVDPPVEQLADHRMGPAQVLEDGRVGGVAGLRPLALGQVQLGEQDLLELLGAAKVELVADVGPDLRLEPGDHVSELAVEQRQRFPVQRDADCLHSRQDRDERELDLAEQPVQPFALQLFRERRPNGEGAQGVEAGTSRRRQSDGCHWQLQVEALGDHVRDRLAAQRGIEDVGADLRVERDPRGRRGRVRGDPGHEQRLDLVTDERQVEILDDGPQPGGGLGSVNCHGPTVAAGNGEGQCGPAERPRVVEDQCDPDLGQAREPGNEGLDVCHVDDLDQPRVGDRRREGASRVAGHLRERSALPHPGRGPRRVCAIAGARARTTSLSDRVEIHGQLEAGTLADERTATRHPRGRRPWRPIGAAGRQRSLASVDGRRSPARGPAADLRGRDRAALTNLAQGRLGGFRRLPRQRRQAVDERPELVLAEEPDHGLAVVVVEPRGIEVELHRQGPHDPHELAAGEHAILRLEQRRAQLERHDLVQPIEHRVERAELPDQLRRGLLPTPGTPGMLSVESPFRAL